MAPSIISQAKTVASYDGANLSYLPIGLDTDYWSPSSTEKKGILTVAACDNSTRLKVKGIDILIETASKMPNTAFTLVGTEPSVLKESELTIPDNLQIVSLLPETELLEYYQSAKVYCQPSRTEGMPNTLMEAMSCGCIPVGTDVGGIPTLMEETGSIVPPNDNESLVQALSAALQQDESDGKAARQRIIKEFSVERRIAGLRKAIEGETEV